MSKRSLISESVTVIRIGVHPAGKEPDNTSYMWPHGSHIRQPFVNSLLGQNQVSVLGMKSWLSAIVWPDCHPGLPHSPSNKPPWSWEGQFNKVVAKLICLLGPIKPNMQSVQLKAYPSGPKRHGP
jgi:hypothetical protein